MGTLSDLMRGAPIIKTGATGGERIAKLNELIRIEEEISDPQMGRIEKYR